MDDKLKWNIPRILNHYYVCCKALYNKPNSDTLKCDKAIFEEMFFELSKLSDMECIFRYINGICEKLNQDRRLLKNNTTKLQLNTIYNFFKKEIDVDIIKDIPKNTYNRKNLINDALKLTKELDSDIYKYLRFCLRHDRIQETNSKNQAIGRTFSTTWGSYIQIKPKQYNALIILIHELMHGFVADVVNERYFYENKMDLYSEVVSILSEFYTNYFLLNNKLITIEEHNCIFNDTYLTYIDDEYKNIKALYNLVNSNTKLTKKNIKKYIKETNQINNDKNLSIKKLSDARLLIGLRYIYSFLIATSLYYTYDNPQDAILAALDLCDSINISNEKEILTKYKIDTTTGIDSYLKDYNKLVKKRNN